MTELELVALLVAAALGGAIQATLGFGASYTTVPVLALVAAERVPAAALVGLLPLTALIAWRERDAIDRSAFLRVAAGRVPGIALGTVVVAVASTTVLSLVIAATLLVGVVATVAGLHVPMTRRNLFAAGVVSGFTGTAAALGGPPLALVYHARRSDDRRATLSAVFTVGLVLALALLALSGQVAPADLTLGAGIGGALLIGAFAAVPLIRRLSEATVRAGVLTWAGAGALVAVARVLLPG